MFWSEKSDPKVCDEFPCRKYEGNSEEATEQEEKLCDEVETVSVR